MGPKNINSAMEVLVLLKAEAAAAVDEMRDGGER